jgi:CheY-like chemotaxis protein
VLIVDDNPMFGRVIFQMLEREGFEPYHVLHGEAAWERLSTTQADLPHAIICDLHMPLMNGQELLQRVKSDVRLRAIPFVVLTSDDDVSAEVGLLARGADAYVLKSKDPRILCAQVRRLVDLSSSQEAA